MPIYEFECEHNHVTEHYFGINDCPKTVICGYFISELGICSMMAEKIWSLPARTDLGAPTRVFINNITGEMFTPIGRYDQPPRGYHEEQLKDSFQRNKFEKEYQRRLDATNEVVTHQLESQKAATTKNRHDDLKARMNAVQREIDPITGEAVEFTLDHRDKEVLKKAMNRTKKKKFRPRSSDFKFAINHNDRSNIDEVK